MKFQSRFLFTLSLAGLLLLSPVITSAQDEIIRSPEELLGTEGEAPTVDAIDELFINCSEWDEDHQPVRDSSKQALIDLGELAVPTLLDHWLSSIDVRRRVTLDEIIEAIGYPSAQYLILYMQDEDWYTRRHTAYLSGTVCYAESLEDPLAVGPFEEDQPAIDALSSAIDAEQDWHVLATQVGALGRFRDPAQIDKLAFHLTHEEQAIRLNSVVGLGKIPDQETVPHLIHAFADPLTTVRQAAILALSTKTMGNLSFEAIVGTSILSPSGETARICALETLRRYLGNIATEQDEHAEAQRQRAFDTVLTVIHNTLENDQWLARAYAVEVIGYTYDADAVGFLENLVNNEEHPFVIGKINEALDRLDEGRPEPVED